jgi:hypothetical protein
VKGKQQVAQFVLAVLHPAGVPADVNQTGLAKAVNDWLRANDPEFIRTRGEIGRVTVRRAARLGARRAARLRR